MRFDVFYAISDENVKTRVNEQFWDNSYSSMIFYRYFYTENQKKIHRNWSTIRQNSNGVEIAKKAQKSPKTSSVQIIYRTKRFSKYEVSQTLYHYVGPT